MTAARLEIGMPRSRVGKGDAIALIGNGFARKVLKQLPIKFAVEAQNLLGIRLEGSVG